MFLCSCAAIYLTRMQVSLHFEKALIWYAKRFRGMLFVCVYAIIISHADFVLRFSLLLFFSNQFQNNTPKKNMNHLHKIVVTNTKPHSTRTVLDRIVQFSGKI